MKGKIADALKTKYKSFGLSSEAWDRIASAIKETVAKEEDIDAGISDVATMNLIAKELQKMRDTEIQKRTDLQREHDDYKAKHPKKPIDMVDDDRMKKPAGLTVEEISALIKDGIAAGIKPIQDAFDAYKNANSAREAVLFAKEAFFSNKWTTKFEDEAADAWERVTELNEAKGGSMTREELNDKATEYFNKAVQRKGTDATRPFEAEQQLNENFDFSKQARYLESEGLIPEDTKTK